MSSGSTARPLPTLKPATKQAAKTEVSVVATPEVVVPRQTGETIKVDLGFSDMVDLDLLGYMPSRPEVILTEKARAAVKRLCVTLEQREAVLADGTHVRNSTSKTIVWLCEKLADSLSV